MPLDLSAANHLALFVYGEDEILPMQAQWINPHLVNQPLDCCGVGIVGWPKGKSLHPLHPHLGSEIGDHLGKLIRAL